MSNEVTIYSWVVPSTSNFIWHPAPGEEPIDVNGRRMLVKLEVLKEEDEKLEPYARSVWIKRLKDDSLELSPGADPTWVNWIDK